MGQVLYMFSKFFIVDPCVERNTLFIAPVIGVYNNMTAF